MAPQPDPYKDLDKFAELQTRPLIENAENYVWDTVKDKVLEALAGTQYATGVNALKGVSDAYNSVTEASTNLSNLSCGDLETGKRPPFDQAVTKYDQAMSSAVSLLDAASGILAVISLVAPAAALPSVTLKMTSQQLKAIQQYVDQLLHAIQAGQQGTNALEQDRAFLEGQDGSGDAQTMHQMYANLPTQKPHKNNPQPKQPPSSNAAPWGNRADPLVLDLDQDGLELTGSGAPPVFFDRDGTGFAAMTSWVDADDGFLARDLDGNGLIETQRELFGNDTLNAFDDLAQGDSNHDGQIDASDAIWSSLRVWRDLNHNGISDAGEVMTLAEAGITSLSLTTQDTGVLIGDAIVTRTGSFVTSDGVTHQSGSANFTINAYFSDTAPPEGTSLTPVILDLPGLHGMGQVYDLHTAMALDASLLDAARTLRQTATSLTGAAFHRQFEALLQQWVGVEAADFTDRVQFLTAFLNHVMRANPADAVGIGTFNFEGTYQEIVDSLALRFAISVAWADRSAGAPDTAFTALTGLTHIAETGVISGFPETIVQDLLDSMPQDHAAAMAWLDQTMPLLSSLQREFYGRNQADWRGDLAGWLADAATDLSLAAYAVDLASAHAVVEGTASAETIVLAHDLFTAQTDTDVTVVEGGKGNDVFRHSFSVLDDHATEVAAFVYSRGDGADRINVTGADHILHRIYLTDIASTDAVIRIGADGLSPVITFLTGGAITFTGVSKTSFAIEVYFADGVVADQFDVINVGGQTTSDNLTGGSGADNMDGGAGSDTLAGAGGDDIYNFFAGGGRDVVNEVQFDGTDTLWLRGYNAADVTVANVAGDAVLTFAGAPNDRVTLSGQFGFPFFFPTVYNGFVERIRFADGTEISADGLVEMLLQQSQTAGDDLINGAVVADTLHLGQGVDTVQGQGGADIFVRDAGTAGDDVLVGPGQNLILTGLARTDVTMTRVGDDLVLAVAGQGGVTVSGQFGGFGFSTIAKVTFGDGSVLWADEVAALFSAVGTGGTPGGAGNDTMTGTGGADVLDGRLGDDLLQGAGGSDTYYWGRAKGSDVVQDAGGGSWAETDRLVVRGITLADLDIARSLSGDLVLTDVTTGQTLTVQGHFSGINAAIEQLRLDFGRVLSLHQLAAAAVLTGTAAGDGINGTALADNIDGAAGNDTINTGDGNDTVRGGAGDDVLAGGTGSDTYVFGLGDGRDRLLDQYEEAGSDGDILRLTGVTLADLSFHLDTTGFNNDLEVRLGTGGDAVVIRKMFNVNSFDTVQDGIWAIRLDDGTLLNRDALRALATIDGTVGDDFIQGTVDDDTLSGGAGNDTLSSFGGEDSFVWGAGDGNDTVFVSEARALAGHHTLRLTGLARADVTLARQANDDLTITNTATGEVLTLTDQFRVTGLGLFSGVGRILFAGGEVLDRAGLAAAFPLAGTGGADVILGTDGADVILGGKGADLIDGLRGDDTVIYLRGDGNDVIADSSFFGEGGRDTLWLKDLNRAQVSFARDATLVSSLNIRVLANGQIVQLEAAFGEANSLQVIRFADGSEIEVSSLAGLAITGGAGAESLRGDDFDSTLLGGLGNDTLQGRAGDDTYLIRPGDGADVVDEGTARDPDDVLVLQGWSLADATFARNGLASMRITLGTGGDSVLLRNELSQVLAGVERVVFDDATLRLPDLVARLGQTTITGFTGDDNLGGNLSNEVFTPLAGNDTIDTGGGQDRVVIGAASGDDRIEGFVRGAGGTVVALPVNLFADFAAVQAAATQVGADVVIDLGGGNSLTLVGVVLSDLESANFGFTAPDIRAVVDGSVLTGTLGADRMLGAVGDDDFTGQAGNDRQFGNGGRDMFHLRDGDGNDLLDGGAEYDQVSYAGPSGVVVNLITGVLTTGSGMRATLTRIEAVETDAGNDSVLGDAQINNIQLGAGQDTASGGGGADFIFGEAGRDRLSGGTGSDLLAGGDDNDTLAGDDGADLLYGQLGNDLLQGGAGNDALSGGFDNDLLQGQTGDDSLTGDFGNDTLTGGAGADVFIFDDRDWGRDRIADFTLGVDRIDMSELGLTAADVVITTVTGGVKVEVVAPQGHESVLFLGLAAGTITTEVLGLV